MSTLTSPRILLRKRDNPAVLVGLAILIFLLLLGQLTVDSFLSSFSLRSMALLASFLGIATVGQTLVALVGGLDLSIAYVIGSANIFALWLIGRGLPGPAAIAVVLALGAVVGALNGLLSLRMQGQALIISLAVGFAVVGLTQIRTTIGSEFGGTVYGQVPGWLTTVSAPNGELFGLPVPPAVLLWVVIALVVITLVSRTTGGRALYAVGGNRQAATYALLSEKKVWVGVYTISGVTAALTGVVLLGFTGGGFVGAGDPYLFTSVAAVVVGGTSLLGGRGGYGQTVLGVLALTVLSALLVGYGFGSAAQQTVLGLLIIPMVALYARSPHPRTRI